MDWEAELDRIVESERIERTARRWRSFRIALICFGTAFATLLLALFVLWILLPDAEVLRNILDFLVGLTVGHLTGRWWLWWTRQTPASRKRGVSVQFRTKKEKL